MSMTELLADMLGGRSGVLLREHAASVTELRLRTGRPAQLRLIGGGSAEGEPIDAPKLARVLNRLMENSLYACEQELRQGYFTSIGGCRVGVCGHISAGRSGIGSLSSIGSACIRFPREIPGCAQELAQRICGDRLLSLLILSPPGLGKTTLLRDLVRLTSQAGYNVCVADERREIAACVQGVPQMDLGPCTDVMDGLEKARAIPMLLRACAPDMIAVDELGGSADADAVMEARRCGAAVAATAHAASLPDALRRSCTGDLLRGGAFDFCAVLGPRQGQILSLHECANERFQYAEGFVADSHPAQLHGGGQGGFHPAQAPL